MRRFLRSPAVPFAAVLVAAALVAGLPAVAGPAEGWTVARVRFEPLDPAHPLGAAGVGSYRGALEVGRSGAGVGVVNEVGVDDYLKGLDEVPASWPAEAQKAQAIAARTYALWEAGRSTATSWRALGADICATDACQVYNGLARELRPNGGPWSAAVEATSGLVITYRGAPIKAKYSSTNGGRTVAGDEPYLRAVDDPDDAHSPYHRWRSPLPLDQLAGPFGLPGRVVAAHRAGAHVVLRWEATRPDGTLEHGEALVPAADFRSTANAAFPKPAGLPLPVPSSRYTVFTEGGAAVVDGRGWGHGIGMSQWGAFGKAHRGMSASDILASYYAGLRPQQLAGRLPATLQVAVAMGRPEASISAVGAFRVLGPSGEVLAHAAQGSWRVVPAGEGVRVIPPGDQAGPPVVDAVVDPASVAVGARPVLHVVPSAPALVQVSITSPTGEAVSIPPVLATGPVAPALPAFLAPGDYAVTVAADAGGGRVTTVPLVVHLPDPAATPAPGQGAQPAPDLAASVGGSSGPGDAGSAVAALAGLLLAAVVAAGVRMGRQTLLG